MAVYSINQEKKFFNLVLDELSKNDNIRLDYSFLPNEVHTNKFKRYYKNFESIWVIRVPINDNEIYYYFGLKTDETLGDNNEIYPRLILKFNLNADKSDIKFFKGNKIFLHLFIEDFRELKKSFNIRRKRDEDENVYYLNILDNDDNLVKNIEKLINLFDFDLNLDNEYLTINSPKTEETKKSKIISNKISNNDFPISIIKDNLEIIEIKQEIDNLTFSSDLKNEMCEYLFSLDYDGNFTFNFNLKDIKLSKNDLIKCIRDVISDFNYSKPSINLFKETLEKRIANYYNNIKEPIKPENLEEIILHHYPSEAPKNYQLGAIAEIIDAIDDGYKFIVLEAGAGFGKSEIAATLVNIYKNSFILRGNERLKNKFLDSFSTKIWDDVYVSDFNEALNEFYRSSSIEKRELLILNDAHMLENEIVHFIEFDSDEKSIPIYLGEFAKKYLLNKGNVCIFMSSTILNYKQFIKEFGINESQVKYIYKDFPLDYKYRIHTRNSVNMKYDLLLESKYIAIKIVDEILNQHKNERGIIFASNNTLKRFILSQINDNRLLGYNSHSNIMKFNRNNDTVLVCSTIDEWMELPNEQAEFQIFFRQPMNQWNDHARMKNNRDSHWYDYKKAIYVSSMLENRIELREEYCDVYMIDDRFLFLITVDMETINCIPDKIINSIVDANFIDCGLVSDNIKKKNDVYYLHDYYTDTDDLSKKIQKYKDYKYDSMEFLDEFMYFTKELMEMIVEFANHILDDDIDKIALVSVPSSKIERDEYATMRNSIDYIERYYNEGKLESEFGFTKEIINCSNLLTRFDDVNTGHNSDERRPYYIEHINSIEFDSNIVSNLDNVAFIILDDITTRGTIMNACEDILVKNNVDRKNVYKFALFKTKGDWE